MGGTGANGSVAGLAIQSDGKILIGGGFGTYNGVARNSIARLNTDGTLDNSFVPPTSLSLGVEYFAIQSDGKILAAGTTTASNGFNPSLIRLNTDGTQDTSLISNTDKGGYHVTLQTDGKILLTGEFSRLSSGENRNSIARYNAGGSLDVSFSPSFTGYGQVNTMARQSDGKILVGGIFGRANGNISYNIARFNADGTFDNTFLTGLGPLFSAGDFNGRYAINAIAIQLDGKILVGGRFGSFNGSTNNLLEG